MNKLASPRRIFNSNAPFAFRTCVANWFSVFTGLRFTDQLHDHLASYYQRIDAGELAVFRGVELSADDQLRRELIMQLICNFVLDIDALEQKWGI